MKSLFTVACYAILVFKSFGQNPDGVLPSTVLAERVIAGIKKAQATLKTVSYTIRRSDTLVTGDVRSMAGQVRIRVDEKDTVLGFMFRSKKDGEQAELIYDGHIGYLTELAGKSYHLITRRADIAQLLFNGGGQIIVPDLIKLDTARTISYSCSMDALNYYLTLVYPDLTEYDVIKRSKVFTINKQSMLPAAVRSHQETLGKVQDLYYQITAMRVNENTSAQDFSSLEFLNGFRQKLDPPNKLLFTLIGKEAPAFSVSSFDQVSISSQDLKGKVVLLDFWEVWCGPCIESMPKVERLYETYKAEGLLVYGIINEVKQLESSKLLVKKKALKYPMLVGNEQLKKDYQVNAIPLYILINKQGKVSFVRAGYTEEIELAIKKALLPA